MRRILIIFSVFLLISTLISVQILGTAYAQEKQKACLAPMGALGDISEMQKQIIFTREYQFPSLNECRLFFAEKYSLDSDVFEIS